jgi:HlyD family secretion protein
MLPERVEAMPVVRRDVARSLVVTGRVRPTARPLLGVSVGGTVTEVLVREGDVVNAGQLVLRLDDGQAAAAVAEARARLAATRADARAAVERTERELALAERDLARARQLHDAGAISPRDLEEAARSAADARAAWEAASARAAGDGSSALASVAQAQASLEAAEARRALTRITAPASATIVARRVEPGDVVTPGQVLLELALHGRTEIVAFASEESLGDLRPGAPGIVSADAYPDETFPAQVSWIAPAVDPGEGTIEMRLDVPEPPPYLLPDMTVSVNVEVARRVGALVVPRDAVLRTGRDSGWVIVARDGRAVRRPVRTGVVAEAGVEICDGLAEGDLVLPTDVEPGARVRPVR